MLGSEANEMSRVILVDAKGMAVENTVVNKLQRLIQESGAADDLSEGMRVAIKVFHPSFTFWVVQNFRGSK